MENSVIQYFGYAASVIIAISMMISSIVKFRWVNLIGALIFSVYGFTFGAYPVGILNGFIVLVDLYYLSKIYSKKNCLKHLKSVRITNICPDFSNFIRLKYRSFSWFCI